MSNSQQRSESGLLAERGITPDAFQTSSFELINEDVSVLVAAPTSSGKTLVAEYAIERALSLGQTVFYTTPIKALSNQKFKDLRTWLGKESVGLLTGDNAIRPNAKVVVMTTEVLRNMIYSGSTRLKGLGLTVLDEVHFLQDPYRGPVWEEVIMQLPAACRLVCLSATVSNARELAGWISEVHGHCEAVIEKTRPVELHDHFLLFDKRHRRIEEFRTLRNGGANFEVERYLGKMNGQRNRGDRNRGGAAGRPRRGEVIKHLDAMDRLPAIFFIFSRQGCDDAVQTAIEHGIDFLDGREKRQVESIVDQHVEELDAADLSLLNYDVWLEGLRAGVAAHHAGMVTPFKEAVEDCFAAGLLKVVFATETLAMGVNLPARSVVVEQLSRFRGEGHVVLTPGEYTQLTGRAGRRGIDSAGHAYALWSPYESFDQLAQLAQSDDFVLESAFRPTYNMAANLMERLNRESAVELLQRSFAQYRSKTNVVRLGEEVAKVDASLKMSRSELKRLGGPNDNLAKSEKEPPARLNKFRPGSILERLHGRESQYLLVLGTTSRRGGEHRIRVVTPRGKVMMLTESDFDQTPKALGEVELPKPYAPNRRDYQRSASKLLKQELAELGLVLEVRRPANDLKAERTRAENQIAALEMTKGSLMDRIAVAEGGLARSLVAIEAVLEEFALASNWALSEKGRVLQSIFHELDLLVTLGITQGLFEGLSPEELAGVLSVLTYEHRSRLDPPDPWYPSALARERANALMAFGKKICQAELLQGLQESRLPDPTIVGQVHGWASGHDLEEVLEDDVSVGDFVRNIRQVIDLLKQVGEASVARELRVNASAAITLLDRGLVAAAARLQDGEVEESSGDDD